MSLQQSIVEQYLADYQSSDDPFLWLIVYDFIEKKLPPKFWKNLEKMMSLSPISRIQYSVLLAENMGDALAVARLVEQYDGLVEVFHGDIFRGG